MEEFNIITYIEEEEIECPYCGGSINYIKHTEFSKKFCTIDINCVLCESSWAEHYDIGNILKQVK